MPDVYVRPEIVNLKNHAEYNERWVHQKIIDDPSILGLGDLEVRDSERIQPSGGRLDLLLQDPESSSRYEVEIQLGKSDEAHIIRTIEYWDLERRRFPQYEHTAVLVAEDITSRFLNVISLFNGQIPIVAIQMKALRVGESISLFSTVVVDEQIRGTDEEDEQEVTDRAYWERKGSSQSLAILDDAVQRIQEIAPGYEVKYNKHYIGLAKDGVSRNFVVFRPRKTTLILQLRHPPSDEIEDELSATDLDVLSYDRRWKYYRVRLKGSDLQNNEEAILAVMKRAHASYIG